MFAVRTPHYTGHTHTQEQAMEVALTRFQDDSQGM